MKINLLIAGRMLALVVVLLAAGCGARKAEPSPAAPPPAPTAKAILPGPTTVRNTATSQPSAAPVSPLQTPVAPLSPLGTPAPLSPLATPSGANPATPRAGASNAATPAAGATAQVAAAAAGYVAAQNGWTLSQVQVVQVEPVMWPDSCLGIQQPDLMCAQVITPGYRITLSTPKGEIEVHTDSSAKVVRIATP